MIVSRKFAVPVAATLALSSLFTAYSPMDHAHAARTAAGYSGTIAWTDNAFPDGTSYGGAFGNTVTDASVQNPLQASPFLLDNHQNFLPELATTVPSTSNGGIKVVGGNEVVTVHLKPNQKWSDGSPITPQDYVFGIADAFAPEVGNQALTIQYKTIAFSGNDMIITYNGLYAPALSYGIPSPNPFEYYNKKYHTSVPASLLASFDQSKITAYYASSAYKGSELQKMIKANLNDNYNSPSDIWAGPYTLKEWTADQRVTEVANPNFTALPSDPAHPRPAQIQEVIITESGTAYSLDMLANSTYSTVDLAEDFRIPDLNTITKSKFKVIIQPALGYSHIELNQKNPALRDVRVRQALQFAIDKIRYIAALYAGQPLDQATLQALALNVILPDASPWSYNSHVAHNLYNPSKAKALLAAAGYATSLSGPGRHLTLEYVCFPSQNRIRSSQLIQRFWGQIGVRVRVRYVPASGPNSEFAPYVDGGVVFHRSFDAIEFGFSTSPDPDQSEYNIDPSQIPSASIPSGANYAGINDPRLVKYFIDARHTLDNNQRHKLYNDMQAYFLQQAYWIPLYTQPNIEIYKGTIGNFKPNPTQQSDFWNSYEWYRTSGAPAILK